MKHKNNDLDVIKAIRKGSREAEIEMYGKPISYLHIYKSKKTYSRKNKHKGSSDEGPF